MIFVTVGTHEQQFNRLLEAIDNYALNRGLKRDDVIVQSGYSDYAMNNCIQEKMFSVDKMLELYKKADIVITHGGPGSMFIPWKYNKTLIAVPRQKKFNEHVDDHQIKFCKFMSKKNRLINILDINELELVLDNSLADKISKKPTYKFNTDNFLKQFECEIDKLMKV